MANRQITTEPVAKTGMLIRRPVAEVFEAVVNPEVTSKFWFSKASGRLDAGKTIRWEWECYDVAIDVTPKLVQPNKRVVIEWPGYSGPTTVEWSFQAVSNDQTFVRVQESGWTGDADQLMRYVADSTQGFTLMLAGMKALLEHGIGLNLTVDRYPKGVDEPQSE
jgi:uncharacterized protein YndB with AHSA1/START domain